MLYHRRQRRRHLVLPVVLPSVAVMFHPASWNHYEPQASMYACILWPFRVKVATGTTYCCRSGIVFFVVLLIVFWLVSRTEIGSKGGSGARDKIVACRKAIRIFCITYLVRACVCVCVTCAASCGLLGRTRGTVCRCFYARRVLVYIRAIVVFIDYVPGVGRDTSGR